MSRTKNYGFKIGDEVSLENQKNISGKILKIHKAGKHGLGFIHASVKYPDGRIWMSALLDLSKRSEE